MLQNSVNTDTVRVVCLTRYDGTHNENDQHQNAHDLLLFHFPRKKYLKIFSWVIINSL